MAKLIVLIVLLVTFIVLAAFAVTKLIPATTITKEVTNYYNPTPSPTTNPFATADPNYNPFPVSPTPDSSN